MVLNNFNRAHCFPAYTLYFLCAHSLNMIPQLCSEEKFDLIGDRLYPQDLSLQVRQAPYKQVLHICFLTPQLLRLSRFSFLSAFLHFCLHDVIDTSCLLFLFVFFRSSKKIRFLNLWIVAASEKTPQEKRNDTQRGDAQYKEDHAVKEPVYGR